MKNTGILLLVYLFLAHQPTHAYLDPGTGSYIAQVLIASLLGVGFVFKSKLSDLKMFIAGMFSKGKDKKKETSKKESDK